MLRLCHACHCSRPAVTASDAQKAAEAALEQWADRLAPYKANAAEGSKRLFGIPARDPALIASLRPLVDEAEAVYSEFLKAGVDPASH